MALASSCFATSFFSTLDPVVKSFPSSENQVSIKVEAKFETGLLI